MKKLLPTLLIAAAMIGFSMNAKAQETSTASIGTEATVVTPIKVEPGQILNFGQIVSTAAGGTITIEASTAGMRTPSSVDLTTGTQNAGQAGTFTVTGQDGYGYSLALPTADFTVSDGDTTTPSTMSVSTFSSNSTGTLTGGSETVHVGATLTVGTNQPAGVYTSAGDFAVTVQYN